MLRNTIFRRAKLSCARLAHASMSHALCDGANLRSADLSFAILCNASFREADLTGCLFYKSSLEGTDFTGADISQAIFARCPSLHLAKGLSEVVWSRSASLDMSTHHACGSHLPPEFLRAVE